MAVKRWGGYREHGNNPDIFGSMFQAIVTPGKRSDLGQHYTSVPNILKTIEPLFLDGLKEQFDAGFDSIKKLEVLLDQIGKIKIFDPSFMRNYCVSRDIGGHPAPRRVYPTGRLTQQISRQAVWRSAG